MRLLSGLLALVLVVAAGCGGERREAGNWELLSEGDLTPAQVTMKSRAHEARETLFSLLGGRLGNAMGTVGPAGAISVCSEEAPQIAAEVSKKHDLTIGRTSFRLRNQNNKPPGWAEPLVTARVEQDTYLEGPEGELGVLIPIRLSSLCVTCHGRSDEISAEVKDALAEKYPADEATGFAPGELRGWFWIEVEPAEDPS